MTRRSGDLEEISKEDSEDESFLQVCSVRRPHLLTMIVSIVEKSVKEPNDDDDDHGDCDGDEGRLQCPTDQYYHHMTMTIIYI